MRRLICLICGVVILCTACTAQTPAPAAQDSHVSGSGDILPETAENGDRIQSFAARHVEITGYLQNIDVQPADGAQVVIHWSGQEREIITSEDGLVRFSTEEPDWMGRGGGPPFTVTSTITVEIPDTIDTVTLNSVLGDITIDGASAYNKLVAITVDGDIIARGMVGAVSAETGRGSIRPDSFGAEITQSDYDGEGGTSKHLETVIPGAADARQNALLVSESGVISINEDTGAARAADYHTDINRAAFTERAHAEISGDGNYFTTARVDVVDAGGYDHQAQVIVCRGSDAFTLGYRTYIQQLRALYPGNYDAIIGYRDVGNDDRTYRDMDIEYFAIQEVVFTDYNGDEQHGVVVALDGPDSFLARELDAYNAFCSFYDSLGL